MTVRRPLNFNVGNVGNLGNVGNDRLVIIQHAKDRLLLITQPDHAALAGRIMRAWKLGACRIIRGAKRSLPRRTITTTAGRRRTPSCT